ncbi:4,5-DOPA dioxygenase extradiol [Dysgonomonas sp. Marseille-P4677]|uniref:4,5-DOPA-extradiol-dioxygenase n=1 Tax=Dysgonomonas sp. Marseille-P4677 TaxID=2364790 RepID=UPI0019122939|nr:4,5-DOPA dioxygenase extradiol [Dysgonomonas sp. Marseille-P4677]MBK5721947.1 4,5-DOPA dioxygenase extradiol [Dysgonomonas sp. Marseille-P4677]
MTLKEFHKQAMTFAATAPMPVLFVGHGTPMNAIENNEFVGMWTNLGHDLPRPHAILCISAHWETRGTFVTAMETPKTIHDFYGFPRELYTQQYAAKGSVELAGLVREQIKDVVINEDYEWGLDHGTWSVLKHVYPQADIPVIQLSIDHFKGMRYHYELGRELAFLRRKGVLIIGSGNMIHNLRMIQLAGDDFNAEHGYEWAFELNDLLKNKILNKDHSSLIDYNTMHNSIRFAIPTPEHYIPLLYALAMQEGDEPVRFFNDKVIAGSLSMTSLIVG